MMEFIGSNEFGKLNVDRLADFENFNQLRLPEDYRQFLIEYNGGTPKFNAVPLSDGSGSTDLQMLFGMHDGPYYSNFFDHIDIYHDRIPKWYIPIGNDSGGNLFIMSLWEGNKGVIAFWDHENEAPEGEAAQYYDNMSKVADSFSEFIGKLKANP